MSAFVENILVRLFVCALMLTSLFTVLQISSTSFMSPAKALECADSVICVGTEAGVIVGGGGGWQSGPPTSGGGTGGGTAPVTVGPGGQVSAPAIPKGENPEFPGEYAALYQLRVTFASNPQGIYPQCAPKQVNGFTVKPRGVIYTTRSDLIGWNNPVGGNNDNAFYNGTPIYSNWYTIKTTCVYPPPPTITGTNMTCLISYSATVDRLAQSFSGAGRVKNTKGTLSSKAQLERDGKSACIQNKRVGLNYNPPAGQKGWGQYTASSQIRQITCSFARTTFDGAVDNMGKCSNEKVVPGTKSNMTIWCNGFSRALLVKDWTGSDCQNTSNARLNCVIPSAATYAGFSGNVQGLRDGKDQLVRWGTPRVTGTGASNAATSNWRSSTVVNAGSTPRNNSGDNNKSKQLFASSIPFSTAMTSGQNLNQNLRFYTAGSAGSPFSMTRNYRFDATFNSIHTTIQSIDLRTGNIGVSNSVTRITARNNKCGPQTSPRIDVVRAIGDSVVGR